MENNTITPTPAPRPQPTNSPMPTFGTSAKPPVTPPAPEPVSAMPTINPAAPSPSPAPAPAATPAAPAPQAPANPQPVQFAEEPAKPAPQVASQPTSQSTSQPEPQSAPAPAAPVSPTPAPAQNAPTTPTQNAPTTPTQNAPTTPGQNIPATPAQTIPAEAPAPLTGNPTSPKPNKSKIIILISIIAALLVAGLIAALICINVVSSKNDPVAIVSEAMANLVSTDQSPGSISAHLEIALGEEESDPAALSLYLDHNNLFVSYTGISALIEDYLDLPALLENTDDSTASVEYGYLLAATELVEFAEDKWWQIPVTDLKLGDAYRKHPFITAVSTSDGHYTATIDSAKFLAFVGEFSGQLDTDSMPTSDLVPTLEDDSIKDALAKLPTISATIDSEHRFDKFSIPASADLPISAEVRLYYTDAVPPTDYSPIEELFEEFLKTIDY